MGATPVIDHAAAAPAPHLQRFVSRYMGYRFEGMDETTHQGLPSRFITLVFSLDDPLDMLQQPGERGPASFGACVGGLHAEPVVLRMPERQRGYQLALSPFGARALLGCPASEVASRCFELRDVLGGAADELRERLAGAPDWESGFAAIDDVLTRELAPAEPSRELAWAWGRIAATHGALPVGDLAEELGWSRRVLAERFRAELGITPKTAARVMRFEYANQLLRQGRATNLADLAAMGGYYDQAHLTRDWKSLAGCTPGEWAAHELPFLAESGAWLEDPDREADGDRFPAAHERAIVRA